MCTARTKGSSNENNRSMALAMNRMYAEGLFGGLGAAFTLGAPRTSLLRNACRIIPDDIDLWTQRTARPALDGARKGTK